MQSTHCARAFHVPLITSKLQTVRDGRDFPGLGRGAERDVQAEDAG